MLDRRSRILGDITPAVMRGLEIGALNNPLVRKSEGDVRYVDYATTEHLRKNQFSDTVRPEDIVDVDIVWAEKPLRDCVEAPVDYVAAVHVIEHVPDVIGWLLDIHGTLKATGRLCLVIPDRRYTFDILRPESTVGEMVQAYLEKRRHPSPGQKFDFTSLWRRVDAGAAWSGTIKHSELSPVGPDHLRTAFAQAEEIQRTGRYMDAHCWAFTPASFFDAASMLKTLGLFPFTVAMFVDTLPGEFEFTLHLCPDNSGDLATLAHARESCRVDKSVGEELAKTKAELALIKRSRSWRMTTPLRRLVRAIYN